MADVKFCGNCGAKLMENADFCGNCGNKVEINQANEDMESTVSIFDKPEVKSDNENKENDAYWALPTEDNLSNIVNSNSYNSTQLQPQPQPQKSKTGLIVGIVAAVLLVLAIIGMTAEKTLQNADKRKANDIDIPQIEEEVDYSSFLDEEEEEKEYEKGTLTSTSYESEFIGIKYTAPDGWVLASETELSEMPTDARTTWEMQALSSLDGSNVIVAAEKLPTKNMTESMYINSLTNNLKNNTQITVTDIKEDGSTNIAGEKYKILTYTGTQDGISYTQTFYIRKINTHMIALAVASTGTPNEEILSGFTKY